MDLCLYAHNEGLPAEAVAGADRPRAENVERVYKDIEAKRRVTEYLLAAPILLTNA